MKERPILFSAPMVRALLAGTKTQTRRVMKNPPVWDTVYQPNGWQWSGRNPGEPALTKWPNAAEIGREIARRALCPYGQPGDRLWVREAWRVRGGREYEYMKDPKSVMFRATHEEDGAPLGWESYRWRPSIHMPRWASRITLEVTGVRVERLQDISADDAAAEGIRYESGSYELEWMTPFQRDQKRIADYSALWESINGPESWSANPWVWVVEFKRMEMPA